MKLKLDPIQQTDSIFWKGYLILHREMARQTTNRFRSEKVIALRDGSSVRPLRFHPVIGKPEAHKRDLLRADSDETFDEPTSPELLQNAVDM